jgi:hypothetical protein
MQARQLLLAQPVRQSIYSFHCQSDLSYYMLVQNSIRGRILVLYTSVSVYASPQANGTWLWAVGNYVPMTNIFKFSPPWANNVIQLTAFSTQASFSNSMFIPSNAHISTPFFQKTVFFSKICFGNPPLKIFGGMSKFGTYIMMISSV